MNTSILKQFAQQARRKLLEQVGAKLSFVLNADSALLREQADQVQQLRLALDHTTKEQLIEKVAYTWFNRLMALRFMDANDYQPIGIRIITPKDGYSTPEILDEAKRGSIPEDLKLNRQKIYDLLDGRIPSANPQNEAYKQLLIASCNHLNMVFPFLFERINDYTELLLPDDLTSDFSIVTDVREGMLTEDCNKVEIIGWLYQFYISEENTRLIESKKVYSKNELAPASQLFTPKWIVQYMVDNTLGQLLTELYPSTTISKYLEFYIKPAYIEQLKPRDTKKLEEIRFFDPCVGSAHILSYAFDVFYLIYIEQGYSESEIPELIISKNLYGTDIDERATQLSSFVLMMKGRQYNRRLFKKEIRPNIACFKDFASDEKFNNASVLGSLIKIKPYEIREIPIEQGNLFADSQSELNKLYTFLSQQYDVVVTNPPYISSSRMEGTLKQYVETNYPDTKSDLFATFIIRCLELCNEDGLTGYMSPFVWMFILSYEKLREIIINNHLINNLIQLEYSGFDGATVPICTFTLRKKNLIEAKSSYIRLTNFKGAKTQAPKTLEAIQNPSCSWFFNANQKEFKKIKGCPIGYWVSKNGLTSFINNPQLSSIYKVESGLQTGDDDRFLRSWNEVSFNSIGLSYTQADEINYSIHRFFPMNKEEGYRKWSGRYRTVLLLKENGINFRSVKGLNHRLRDSKFYFQTGVSWGDLTSAKSSYRYQDYGLIFARRAPMIFTDNKYLCAILNSKITNYYQEVLNPTLSFNLVDMERIPILEEGKINDTIKLLVEECINISSLELAWNECYWNFSACNLLKLKSGNSSGIREAIEIYQQYWKTKFFKLHKNEEDLNRELIEIYGLKDVLSPDVSLEDITILQQEVDKKSLVKLNRKFQRDTNQISVQNYNEIELPFIVSEIMAQFISFSVGCMFGRYSLDKEGLISANQGETIEDYLLKIGKLSNECIFLPDEDNIIPVLDDEWFEDDIIGRFYQFLKVTFGEQNFNKNLAFIEEQLGKDIRKYFTKDFYADHIQRYKKRPIYWMFSSSKGSFNVLIYMHRYNPDTLSNILNKYLREFVGKLKSRKENLQHILVNGSPAQITSAIKENDSIDRMLIELQEYERDTLFPLAAKRISIDLDDGVLVNYNKFGKAVKEVAGLNDAVTKKKVREFDWIDSTTII